MIFLEERSGEGAANTGRRDSRVRLFPQRKSIAKPTLPRFESLPNVTLGLSNSEPQERPSPRPFSLIPNRS
jgi:hypothetical protein